MNVDEAFSKNLDSIMELNQIKNVTLAEKCGLDATHLGNIRRGKGKIKLSTAYVICRGLRRTLDEMTKGADE